MEKFLAACLIAFSTILFACDTKIKGEQQTDILGAMVINQPKKIDTALCKITAGNLIVWDSTINYNINLLEKSAVTTGYTITVPPETTTGAIVVPPMPDASMLQTIGTPAIIIAEDSIDVKTDSTICNKQIFYE